MRLNYSYQIKVRLYPHNSELMLALHYNRSVMLVTTQDEYNQFSNFYIEAENNIQFTFYKRSTLNMKCLRMLLAQE